jgi:hypothetical protein
VLDRLLQQVAEDGRADPEALARALDVSPALVEAMLDDLAHRGYLDALGAAACTCDGCPLHPACLFKRRARLWAVTEKGQRRAARGRDSTERRRAAR